MKQKSKTKKNLISKTYHTDRLIDDKKKILKDRTIFNQHHKKSSFFENINMAGNEKSLIQ